MSEQLPGGGIEVSSADLDVLEARWSSCWNPSEVAERLAGVDVPWCVAAGWALDLFRGNQIREHGDIEIAVPASRFPEIRVRFPGYAFDAVGDHRIWENATPKALAATHQTWLRRDETIRFPYVDIIGRSTEWIPYLSPESVLLFNAKASRHKDQADFDAAVPFMTSRQQDRRSEPGRGNAESPRGPGRPEGIRGVRERRADGCREVVPSAAVN